MVLPPGAHHATLNLDVSADASGSVGRPRPPTLAIGRQLAWGIADRLGLADSLLKKHGRSCVAGHAIAGTALATKLVGSYDASRPRPDMEVRGGDMCVVAMWGGDVGW